MDEYKSPAARAKIFGKIIAAVFFVSACYYFFILWFSLIKDYIREGIKLSDFLFLLIFSIPFSIFLGYCVFIAYKAFSKTSAQTLKSIWFIFAIAIFCIAGGIGDSLFIKKLDVTTSSPLFQLTLIFSMIPAGLFYFLAGKYFNKWLGADTAIDWEKRKIAAQRFFAVTAYFIFGFLMSYSMEFEKSKIIDSEKFPLLIFVTLLVSVVIPFLFYKIAMRIAMKGCPCEQFQTNPDYEPKTKANDGI